MQALSERGEDGEAIEIEPDQVLFTHSHGDAAWFRPLQLVESGEEDEPVVPSALGLGLPIAFAPTLGPLLRSTDLTAAAAGQTVDDVLSLESAAASQWMSAARAILAEIDWLESFESSPRSARAELISVVRRAAPTRDEAWAAGRVEELQLMLEQPEVRALLSRGAGDPSARSVEHELPFARLVDGALETGALARVVIQPAADSESDARPDDVHVIGLVGERVATREEASARARSYRELVRAWRQAAGELWGLGPRAVRVTLLFLSSGYAISCAHTGRSSS
jgi:hypothetical protein